MGAQHFLKVFYFVDGIVMKTRLTEIEFVLAIGKVGFQLFVLRQLNLYLANLTYFSVFIEIGVIAFRRRMFLSQSVLQAIGNSLPIFAYREWSFR